MLKKSFIILSLIGVMVISGNVVQAEPSVQMIQSPIYTDDIGRSHFLGKGGYSSVRQTQMNQAQSDFVNDAVNSYSNVNRKIETKVEETMKTIDQKKERVESDITNVIQEKKEIPVTAKTKASFNAEQRLMDASASFGQGATNLPGSNLNKSKTLYTDDIGRLHFFGKGNIVKE